MLVFGGFFLLIVLQGLDDLQVAIKIQIERVDGSWALLEWGGGWTRVIEVTPLLVEFLLLLLVIVIVIFFGVKSLFLTCVELAFRLVDRSIPFRSQIFRRESGLFLEEKELDGGEREDHLRNLVLESLPPMSLNVI